MAGADSVTPDECRQRADLRWLWELCCEKRIDQLAGYVVDNYIDRCKTVDLTSVFRHVRDC